MRSLFWLSGLLSLLLSSFGCGSPLVGLECDPGFERCGSICVDVSRDDSNCGACGTSCGAGEMCIEASCAPDTRDGGTQDAGGDGDADAGPDAGDGDGRPQLPPACSGPGSQANCVCGIGQIKCGTTCRNVGTDPNHCGACDQSCGAGGFCIGGTCAPSCEAPLTQCRAQCVDLENDPQNCGSCGRACESGLCAEGECIGVTAGHIVAMGHDMTNSTPATRRLLGNAVFLPLADPVRILAFDEKASNAVKAGVENAVMSMASITSRNFEFTSATSLAVTFLLSMSDVFVIEAQTLATNSSLLKNGETWSLALTEFLARGGVIVLMEGPNGANDGTYQLLKAAGLFSPGGRVAIGRKQLSLVSPGDGVATAVPTFYLGGAETMGFDAVVDGTVVVTEPTSDTPVVIHIAR